MLTREDMLNASDLPREEVPVPEWGGTVWVRAITAGERDTYEAESIKGTGKDVKRDLTNSRARLAVLAICDDKGAPVFDQPGDAALLGMKSAAALDRVWDVAARLAGMTTQEEIKKNSESGQSEGSRSA